jgi:hypothetical protein
MAIDVATLRPTYGSREGDVVVRLHRARLTGESGTVTYPVIRPDRFCRWVSAELMGLQNPAGDGVRVRVSDGESQFWLDENDMVFKAVTDESTWDTEFMAPWLLGNLDLWTRSELGLVVHLVATITDPDPQVGEIRVLADFPTWEGAISHCIRRVATFLGDVSFVLVHRETLAAARSEWKIGGDYTEFGYNVVGLVQVTVDGVHKSADFSDGVVTLKSTPAQSGSAIEIAVLVQPSVTVRRDEGSRTVHIAPEWWMASIVEEAGMTGVHSSFLVGGTEVRVREQDITVTINGIASRQADALAMRLGLQAAFSDGLVILLPIGRCLAANLLGFVEVIETGPAGMPQCTGKVRITIKEYVSSKVVRVSRDENGPVTTSLSLEFPGLVRPVSRDEFNC